MRLLGLSTVAFLLSLAVAEESVAGVRQGTSIPGKKVINRKQTVNQQESSKQQDVNPFAGGTGNGAYEKREPRASFAKENSLDASDDLIKRILTGARPTANGESNPGKNDDFQKTIRQATQQFTDVLKNMSKEGADGKKSDPIRQITKMAEDLVKNIDPEQVNKMAKGMGMDKMFGAGADGKGLDLSGLLKSVVGGSATDDKDGESAKAPLDNFMKNLMGKDSTNPTAGGPKKDIWADQLKSIYNQPKKDLENAQSTESSNESEMSDWLSKLFGDMPKSKTAGEQKEKSVNYDNLFGDLFKDYDL